MALATVPGTPLNCILRRTVAVGVVAMILLGSACLPAPPSWKGEGVRVVVFGDSLTHSIEHGRGLTFENQFLTDELVADAYSASVSSMIGANTRDLPAVTPKIPAPGADIMLIALGTNDMRVNAEGEPAVPLAEALAHITTAIDEVGASCSVLVTVAETKPWGLDTSAPSYNDALRDLPDVVIADWAPLVEANPGLVGADGVHLTPDGSIAYRALFHTAIDTCASGL